MDSQKPVDVQSGTTPSNNINTVSEGRLPNMSLNRTLPRQVSTGNQRGIQTITGTQIVTDPNTNAPVISQDGPNQRILITQPVNGTTINRIVIGLMPDGNYGIAISKPGYDVLDAFSS